MSVYRDHRFLKAKRRLKRLLGGRPWRRSNAGRDGGVEPGNLVWIFGAGRTGSTWLARMMGDLEGHTVWFEPWVGGLFETRPQLEGRKGKHFILSPRYEKVWLNSIRRFVLDGANARFYPRVARGEYLVVKEPGGSAGAGLLMRALPESRMVLLVRDPRDVAASWRDAHNKGDWVPKKRRAGGAAAREQDSNKLVDRVARRYRRNVGEAKKAYDAHEGHKVLVRYEDLRAEPVSTMKRIYSTLEIPVDAHQLERVVREHSWENIPKREKGEGKFYRKATPGGWREELTPQQVARVEKITAPLLRELYPA